MLSVSLGFCDWLRYRLLVIRAVAFLSGFLVAIASDVGHSAPLRTAVFDLEFHDTSLEGEISGSNSKEQLRLAMLTNRLREALAQSGRYDIVDIGPVREPAQAMNLQNCGGCDRRLAAELGADLAVTGVVQKVSNLILNINIYVRDVRSGKLVEGHSADIRSNTDESWLRGLNWILKNRILAAERP
jgi:hypothetical protein